MTIHPGIALTGASVAVLALAGCATPSDANQEASDGTVRIVASTSVYGDIAQVVAGGGAEVTSIITNAAQDPHSFEASAQDQLAVVRADLVIANGGGYDEFLNTLLDASSNSDTAVITAVDVSGLLPEEEGHEEEGHDHIEGFNEHVWYDFAATALVAKEIAHELGELDPVNKAAYESNYRAFADDIEGLERQAAQLQDELGGTGVAITEPVPVYLLEAIGLVNETPDEFSESVEEGTDLSARVLAETLGLLAGGEVEMLAYNEQVSSPETDQVRAAAEDAGIEVVNFTETLPEGQDYVSWMRGNLDAVSAALG